MLKTNSHVTAGFPLEAEVNLLILPKIMEQITDTGKKSEYSRNKRSSVGYSHIMKCAHGYAKALLKGILSL